MKSSVAAIAIVSFSSILYYPLSEKDTSNFEASESHAESAVLPKGEICGIVISGPFPIGGGISNVVVRCNRCSFTYKVCALVPTALEIRKGDTVIVKEFAHHYTEKRSWTTTLIAEPLTVDLH